MELSFQLWCMKSYSVSAFNQQLSELTQEEHRVKAAEKGFLIDAYILTAVGNNDCNLLRRKHICEVSGQPFS